MPRRCRHIWIRREKFSMTLPHSSLGIALIAAVIAAFRSGTVWGLLPYTLSLRYPHIWKSGGFKSGEYGDHCGSHLRLISRSGKRCCSHANDSFEWGVAPSCWNHWRTLTTPLRRPSGVQNLPSTWTYRSVLIVTDRSLSSSNQNDPMMPCSEMATQAVHFTECSGLCRQCSGGVLPQKMLFLEFMWPDNKNMPQLSCVDRLLPKICLNHRYLLLSSPWHLEGQIW